MENKEWSNFIEELKRKNDIVDVVSLYANLKIKGKNHWACCPFHGEKTPSFTVNQSGQFYKCFGCGEFGDVIKFVEKVEHIDFIEAVQFLAKRVNMTLPQTNEDDTHSLAIKKEKELCYQVCLSTAKFYNENLQKSSGAVALEYLRNRGISINTATVFGLGYSLDWDGLPSFLRANNFDLSIAEKSGIIAKNSSGKYYDALAGRLIVPIIDGKGNVVAFGGRLLEKKPDFAKYKNTSETPIFEKRKNLFAYNLLKSKKSQQRLDSVIMVEGYMDVIALYQYGFTNVLASMGTSLTVDQARLLHRLTDEVIICYDGDTAGQSATIRGLDILKNEGLHVLVATMPFGVDPDELVRKSGANAYQSVLTNALPLAEYKLNLIKSQFPVDGTNPTIRQEAKRRYATKALEFIKTLDSVEQESYINIVAMQTGLSSDFIKRELKEVEQKPLQVDNKEKTIILNAETKALCFIAKALLYSKSWAKLDKKPPCLGNNDVEKVLDYVFDCKNANKSPVVSHLFEIIDETNDLFNEIISDTFTVTNVDEKYFHDCLSLVYSSDIKNQIALLTDKYNNSANEVEKKSLVIDLSVLTAELKKYKRK